MGKASEFGGEGAHKNTILKNKPRRALKAHERLRLIFRTGSDNPEGQPDSAFFQGRRPE